MVLSVDNYKFYDYDPGSNGELIVTTSFKFGNFECSIEGFTFKSDEIPYNTANKKYVCHYTRGNKRYKQSCFDTYLGFEEEEIKKSIRHFIDHCYNNNKKGRKIKFE